MQGEDLEAFCRRIPKLELHAHVSYSENDQDPKQRQKVILSCCLLFSCSLTAPSVPRLSGELQQLQHSSSSLANHATSTRPADELLVCCLYRFLASNKGLCHLLPPLDAIASKGELKKGTGCLLCLFH